ncbi:MAG: hypothetical protein FWD32_02070, partial [Firmicutes bacterium]|nr:hypothetical protein [Bacillota bacterium]
ERDDDERRETQISASERSRKMIAQKNFSYLCEFLTLQQTFVNKFAFYAEMAKEQELKKNLEELSKCMQKCYDEFYAYLKSHE